jgi:ribulose-5-phosphate 4-epimerase/fuculose-1-phosphate aldolase
MPQDDGDRRERELVAKACRMLGKLDLTKAGMGHVSQRSADGKYILIRAKGFEEIGVRYTTADHILKVALDGSMAEERDGLEPPGEIYIHTWLYRTQPETRSVVHVHPISPMLFTICDKPLLPLFGGYDPALLALLLDGIPIYDRSVTIKNDRLAKEFAEIMGDKKGCLMRGHGITTTGSSVEDATITAIRVNEIAEINYRARMLGDPRPISDEDLAEFDDRDKAIKGRENQGKTREGAAARLAAAWRYFSQLSGEWQPG